MRTFGVAAVALTLSWSAKAKADPVDDAARADASFKEAMELRNAGQEAQACPRFAESQRLAPAVGVTLYLADCYERVGKTASAWREFRRGEKLAREHNDKRADVAAQRAAALEPQLVRLTVTTPPTAASAGAEVQVDGATLPADAWNVALAVDPGVHVVTFAMPGQAIETFSAHADASSPSAIVHIDGPAPAAAPVAAVTEVPAAPPPSSNDSALRWGAVGLMVAGAAGIGIGTYFVTSKTRVMDNGELCEPHLRHDAIPAAAVGFSVGGLALISGITLYYLHRPGRAEVSLSTALVPGGAGALLRTTF